MRPWKTARKAATSDKVNGPGWIDQGHIGKHYEDNQQSDELRKTPNPRRLSWLMACPQQAERKWPNSGELKSPRVVKQSMVRQP